MSSNEYKCIFCKETFSDKETLQIHFRKHGDPTFNSNSKPKIGNTSESSSENPTKEAEMISCDVCTESFPTISKAITHKHKMHPEHTAKYFCPWCGKLFTMKHLYNKHMQSTHESTVKSDDVFFHCDCCDVDFYVPSAMHNHNKFFHRQEADSHDLGQSKKIKSYNQQTYLLYYCSFCGEEYNNKVNLQKHNEDDHSDEDNSFTEVLRCPMCDAVFYHLDAYELHLSFHSVDDVYSDELHSDFSTLTEFSLETVPPFMEKIENETVGDNFLELALADSLNNDDTGESSERVKSKKRKKHKKSKKEAITLDEFLNMNNIFGEGIDIQGIEEVPKQAITKQLKKRPKTSNSNAPSSSDLQKLRKQGIIIKKKSNNVPTQGPKLNKQPPNILKPPKKTSSINTSNDALNKLMNQTNNQIRIVKKSAQETNEKPVSPVAGNQVSPKNILPETDHNEEDSSTEETRQDVETDQSQNDDESIPISKLKTEIDISKSHNDVNLSEEPNDVSKGQDSSNIAKNFEMEKTLEPLSSLKNLSSNITIKSVNQDKELLVSKSIEEVTTEHCDSDDDNVSSSSNTVSETPNKTLSALKHLSHLITVKPLNKNSASAEKQVYGTSKDLKNDSREEEPEESPNPNEGGIFARNETIHQAVQVENKQNNGFKTPHGNLRNLSQNITVKSVPNVSNIPVCSSPKMSATYINTNSNEEDECEDYDEIILKTNAKKSSDEKGNPSKVTGNLLGKSENLSTLPDSERLSNNVGNVNKDLNVDILKRLTTITAKPVSTTNHNKMVNPLSSHAVSTTKTSVVNYKITDEIFSIDDSDSDEREDTLKNKNNAQTMKKSLQDKRSTDILKAINKTISVKPIKLERTSDEEDMDALPESSTEEKTNNDEEIVNTPKNIKILPNTVLNNVLMNLSKNITIKPKNTSFISKKLNKEQQLEIKDNCMKDDDDDDSDFDLYPGKVKISEVNDENASNDDQQQSDAIIETPNDSNSDTDFHSDHGQDLNDFDCEDMQESQSKESKKPLDISQFKNLSKNITIKSLNQSKAENNGVKESSSTLPNINKNSIVKSNKQVVLRNELINKNERNTPGSSVSETTTNKGSSQINTVNKQVKMQTFESETIIEEITTTVTKTIRKVNQTVQQQNVSQMSTPIRCQKVLNMPTRLPGPNTQGVRQIIPNFRPKIRPSIRSAVGTTVRPSNQLVPVRPRMNLASNNPRLPNVRKTTPTTINQQTPLRISPQAKFNQPQKRPLPTVETPGPFSCFKKPKESSPLPNLSNSQGDNILQFASTSQSKSNFSSSKQVVKGNSVVTSTQTKSAMSASSQQLTRLSSMSGLKIVKTSQSKEAVVEEKAEVCASKRSALEAIEKLQRQGLLIKKPCIDYNEYSEHSNSDVDE